ncbi:hypothetical protein L484_006801 [Morus notabilis]|uniref:Uncharacterized protein n=1 Tax=Morus notabilis TaxID=981085 RepID=W9RG37_9ROSA|nr:hypothetical protein L484_006801 [Morus notabilis]
MSTCRPLMGKVVGHEMPRTSQALVLEDFHEVPTERSDSSMSFAYIPRLANNAADTLGNWARSFSMSGSFCLGEIPLVAFSPGRRQREFDTATGKLSSLTRKYVVFASSF